MTPSRKILLALSLLLLVVRFLVLLQYALHDPFYEFPILDSRFYLDWAEAILNHQQFFASEYHHPPAYAYFLATTFYLFGKNYFTVLFLQNAMLCLDGLLL